jgi:peroxiredoxin Q/BCP
LTSSGLSIYGLSADGPKANTTFKTKYTFPYDLICNPSYSLIGAVGLQDKPAKKTKRGVFIIDKSGKVLELFQGGPEPTVDATKKIVDGMEKIGHPEKPVTEDKKVADTAGEVADTAEKLDG